jgi:hypothetical protein
MAAIIDVGFLPLGDQGSFAGVAEIEPPVAKGVRSHPRRLFALENRLDRVKRARSDQRLMDARIGLASRLEANEANVEGITKRIVKRVE